MNKQGVTCGVAVVVTHQNMVLFGRRESAAHHFQWQLPGGWIELGESPREAARREVHEETGLQLAELEFVGVTSNVFSADEHSVSLYFEAECRQAERLSPPGTSGLPGWEWRCWEELDQNLFLPLRLLKESGYLPFCQGNNRACVSL